MERKTLWFAAISILIVGLFLTDCSRRSCLFHADWYPEWKEAEISGFNNDTYRIEVDGQVVYTWPVKGLKQEQISILFDPPGSTKTFTERHIRTLRIGPNSYLVEINGEIQPWPVKPGGSRPPVLNQRNGPGTLNPASSFGLRRAGAVGIRLPIPRGWAGRC